MEDPVLAGTQGEATDRMADPPAHLTPPAGLPADAREFYAAGGEMTLPPVSENATPALETLGPAPFQKGKFPFLGFLASVYEHIATHARERVKPDQPGL